MTTTHRHPFLNRLCFKLCPSRYRSLYQTILNQREYEAKGLPRYSLVDALLDQLWGRKYYIVILSRPNLHVKGTGGKSPFESSSDIFFSRDEAVRYYEQMHDSHKNAVFNSHEVVAFRSHLNIPVWNMQRDPNTDQLF